jgi:ABC-type antimicrobial peptide transport system permease subunit
MRSTSGRAWSISASLVLGILLGMLAGYGPRWLDNALLLLFDTVRSFPTIMFALAAVTLTGPSLGMVILIIVVTSVPVYGRIVRTQTLSLKATEFILAERALGLWPSPSTGSGCRKACRRGSTTAGARAAGWPSRPGLHPISASGASS